MNTKAYFDTSALLKIYFEENGSREATAKASSYSSLLLGFVGEMELRNGLRVLRGRNLIYEEELGPLLACIDQDFESGRLQRANLDPAEIESTCFRLSKDHASKYLCRTLDIIHVATAIISGVKTFVTCDHRQAQLAHEVGLHLHYIDLNKTA